MRRPGEIGRCLAVPVCRARLGVPSRKPLPAGRVARAALAHHRLAESPTRRARLLRRRPARRSPRSSLFARTGGTGPSRPPWPSRSRSPLCRAYLNSARVNGGSLDEEVLPHDGALARSGARSMLRVPCPRRPRAIGSALQDERGLTGCHSAAPTRQNSWREQRRRWRSNEARALERSVGCRGGFCRRGLLFAARAENASASEVEPNHEQPVAQ